MLAGVNARCGTKIFAGALKKNNKWTLQQFKQNYMSFNVLHIITHFVIITIVFQ